ncbi:MAG: hypothetical protein JO147_06235 [Actinobacteria bacterium]|nr:hypothetical protein [Actinomycetota bacterium]
MSIGLSRADEVISPSELILLRGDGGGRPILKTGLYRDYAHAGSAGPTDRYFEDPSIQPNDDDGARLCRCDSRFRRWLQTCGLGNSGGVIADIVAACTHGIAEFIASIASIGASGKG